MPGVERRVDLAEFLRARRAALSPEQVGLVPGPRRRTPGLRREEVAMLAGVSVSWYTWLEQGRDIQVSADVLERIRSTLRMSPDEREYLFALVQHRPAPPVAMLSTEVSPTIARMIEAIGVPALVMTARWDVIAWNRLTVQVFRHYEQLAPEQRNLLRILLVDDASYQADPLAYEAMVRRVLSKFRVDYSQTPDDPSFERLIEELAERCPIFRRLWNSPEVLGRSEAVAHHPQLGGITFEHSSYLPEGSPTLRVVIFVPYDEQSIAKVRTLREEQEPAAHKQRPAKKPN